MVGTAEHTASCSLAGNPLDGTAEVEVKYLGTCCLSDAGSLDHGLYLTAVDLDSYGALLGVDL